MKSIFEQNGGTDCHGCKPFKALISCFAEVKAYFQLYSPRTGSKFSLQLCVEIWSAGGSYALIDFFQATVIIESDG